ncbi:Hypothetical Protein OBI_RACECAR_76 [Arthrobacter phage Racecar]|nr:hypothetical protein PBI_RACECAR_158 [Arthrobacter phage Racecar]QFG12832.1 hypothetical protein PBI_MIMI_155 [Arthrobacter phage Mimi]
MRNLITLVTDIVAVHRLTKLVMEDKLTEDLRSWIYKKFPYGGKMQYLIGCPWCVSIWAGIVIFGLRKLSPETANYLSATLAASYVSGVAYTRGL